MSTVLKTFAAAAVAFCAAGTATAAPIHFEGGWNLTHQTTDPGLKLNSQALMSDPFSLDLNAGDSVTYDLFRLWVNESDVGVDDVVSSPISVSFAFTAPPPAFGGGTTGTTQGVAGLVFIGPFPVPSQWGELAWTNDSIDLTFGAANDGLLRLDLSDGVFSQGLFGLNQVPGAGIVVQATFSLINAPSEVPAPPALAVLGVGLAGVAWARRRRDRRIA
jgi:hypothetical protein